MVIGGEAVDEMPGVRRLLVASTEPPMVIGGEPRIPWSTRSPAGSASTEPPMVIGGEQRSRYSERVSFPRLQRSRRW